YGPPEGLIAVNTLHPADRLAMIDFTPLSARLEPYRVGEPKDLRGPVFLTALGLLLLDALIVLSLAGGTRRLLWRRATAALVAGIALAALASTAAPVRADPASDDFAKKPTLEPRLAYVVTGKPEVDSVSKP